MTEAEEPESQRTQLGRVPRSLGIVAVIAAAFLVIYPIYTYNGNWLTLAGFFVCAYQAGFFGSLGLQRKQFTNAHMRTVLVLMIAVLALIGAGMIMH